MSFSIPALLVRNLNDVFGENDPVRRRTAINEIFHENAVFYEPNGIHHGRDEIDRVAGAIKATHPDFRYQPIAEPEVSGDGGRVRWVNWTPPGEIAIRPVLNGPEPLDEPPLPWRAQAISARRSLMRSIKCIGSTAEGSKLKCK
jgi:hypothetical protein